MMRRLISPAGVSRGTAAKSSLRHDDEEEEEEKVKVWCEKKTREVRMEGVAVEGGTYRDGSRVRTTKGWQQEIVLVGTVMGDFKIVFLL